MLIDDSNMVRGGAEQTVLSGKCGAPGAREVEQRVVRDEVDEQLLPVFLEEANELYPKILRTMQAWRAAEGADASLSNQLQRSLHTFKGSARMAGAMRLGELAHHIEGQVAGLLAQSGQDTARWDALLDCLARIDAALKELENGEAVARVEEVSPFTLQQGYRQSFSCVSERLYRVVRQTAKELGKRVNLELSGGNIELDCTVLERMTAPLEHLLRNAIAHGIESPERRKAQGKAAIGEINLSLCREGNKLVFELSDDGAGLDMPRLQRKALEQGLLTEGQAISEELAIQLILKPGLSTAEAITEIAGRGIGLDVVMSEVTALGGRMDVVPMQEQGLGFIIFLPLLAAPG